MPKRRITERRTRIEPAWPDQTADFGHSWTIRRPAALEPLQSVAVLAPRMGRIPISNLDRAGERLASGASATGSGGCDRQKLC